MASPATQVSVDAEIRRLSAEVRRLERRYGRSSASMLEAVRSGEAKSTGDICDWLSVYDNLRALEETAGRVNGSPTNATASSTKATSPR